MGTPGDGTNSNSDDSEEPPVVVRNAVGLQRLKLEKLMKNPEKPVIIPERQKDKKLPHVPDFVRNVMGSSAGAGSGEFHVYRHLRRKEYARQKYIQEKGEKILLEDEYQQKLQRNKQAAEEKTAKKRAKRLKKKENLKKKKLMKNKSAPANDNGNKSPTTSEDSTDDESNCEDKSVKECDQSKTYNEKSSDEKVIKDESKDEVEDNEMN